MTFTEDDAKDRWCPFAHTVSASDGAVYDTRGQSRGHTHCIASQCMAWRWGDPQAQVCEFHAMGMSPEGEGWTCTISDDGRETFALKSRWVRENPSRCGYCGLAGKVEP